MAPEDRLDINIERIRELGIAHGLDDRQIDECILDAIRSAGSASAREEEASRTSGVIHQGRGEGATEQADSNTSGDTLTRASADKSHRDGNLQTSPSTKRNKHMSCCRCMSRAFLCLVFLALLTLALSFHNPQLPQYSYPAMRLVRLLTYPWVETLELQAWHEERCLVPNPYFRPPPLSVDCPQCRDISSVHQYSRERGLTHELFQTQYHSKPQPLLVTDVQEMIATFADLVKLYSTHAQQIEAGQNRLYCTDKSVTNLRQLFTNVTESHIRTDTFFRAQWHTTRIGASQVLRRLFPRPYFVPRDSEVPMDKFTLVHSPTAQTFMVPRTEFPDVYYLQASGTRRVELSPSALCRHSCSPISLTMMPGHILHFLDVVWELHSLPVFGQDALDQINVAYVGSFS